MPFTVRKKDVAEELAKRLKMAREAVIKRTEAEPLTPEEARHVWRIYDNLEYFVRAVESNENIRMYTSFTLNPELEAVLGYEDKLHTGIKAEFDFSDIREKLRKVRYKKGWISREETRWVKPEDLEEEREVLNTEPIPIRKYLKKVVVDVESFVPTFAIEWHYETGEPLDYEEKEEIRHFIQLIDRLKKYVNVELTGYPDYYLSALED